MSGTRPEVVVRNTEPEDFPRIVEICKAVYPKSAPWRHDQLESHRQVFPEGQFVAVTPEDGRVVGMAASLVVKWDDYDHSDSWRDFTDHGMFTNHDPENGHTLYAAEIMVDPTLQGRGVGSKIYAARRALAREKGLWRIRAGARLRGYSKHADGMTAEEYAAKVSRGELWDPTVSFQIRHGFRVFDVVRNYLSHDPESLGYAALIEWLNKQVAPPGEDGKADPRYRPSVEPDEGA